MISPACRVQAGLKASVEESDDGTMGKQDPQDAGVRFSQNTQIIQPWLATLTTELALLGRMLAAVGDGHGVHETAIVSNSR